MIQAGFFLDWQHHVNIFDCFCHRPDVPVLAIVPQGRALLVAFIRKTLLHTADPRETWDASSCRFTSSCLDPRECLVLWIINSSHVVVYCTLEVCPWTLARIVGLFPCPCVLASGSAARRHQSGTAVRETCPRVCSCQISFWTLRRFLPGLEPTAPPHSRGNLINGTGSWPGRPRTVLQGRLAWRTSCNRSAAQAPFGRSSACWRLAPIPRFRDFRESLFISSSGYAFSTFASKISNCWRDIPVHALNILTFPLSFSSVNYMGLDGGT